MVRATRFPAGFPADTARLLTAVAEDVLAAADEPVEVQFSAWEDDDGRARFVCRVEGPAADPFSDAQQFRWWSAILETADELRAALTAALERRRGQQETPALRTAPPRRDGAVTFISGRMEP